MGLMIRNNQRRPPSRRTRFPDTVCCTRQRPQIGFNSAGEALQVYLGEVDGLLLAKLRHLGLTVMTYLSLPHGVLSPILNRSTVKLGGKVIPG
jgi:hypothetical protein